MGDRPEFGKRTPQRLPDMQPAPAPKRSRHVALLVMGTFAIGGSAYALMGRQSCQPSPPVAPGIAAPAQPQSACTSRGSSFSGGIRSSHFSFFGGGSPSVVSTGGSDSASGGVSRGGFGGIAHAFGFGSS
jgi:hypothetical protein